jgi:hypothetical protein
MEGCTAPTNCTPLPAWCTPPGTPTATLTAFRPCPKTCHPLCVASVRQVFPRCVTQPRLSCLLHPLPTQQWPHEAAPICPRSRRGWRHLVNSVHGSPRCQQPHHHLLAAVPRCPVQGSLAILRQRRKRGQCQAPQSGGGQCMYVLFCVIQDGICTFLVVACMHSHRLLHAADANPFNLPPSVLVPLHTPMHHIIHSISGHP